MRSTIIAGSKRRRGHCRKRAVRRGGHRQRFGLVAGNGRPAEPPRSRGIQRGLKRPLPTKPTRPRVRLAKPTPTGPSVSSAQDRGSREAQRVCARTDIGRDQLRKGLTAVQSLKAVAGHGCVARIEDVHVDPDRPVSSLQRPSMVGGFRPLADRCNTAKPTFNRIREGFLGIGFCNSFTASSVGDGDGDGNDQQQQC